MLYFDARLGKISKKSEVHQLLITKYILIKINNLTCDNGKS